MLPENSWGNAWVRIAPGVRTWRRVALFFERLADGACMPGAMRTQAFFHSPQALRAL
jgi:hypothetical protein